MDQATLRMLAATREVRRQNALQAARRIAEGAALVARTLERPEGTVSYAGVYADELPERVKVLHDNLLAITAADDVIDLIRAEEAEAAGAAREA